MATTVTYDGTKFDLFGDTSYDIASEYLYGVQYEVSFGIKIVSETNPPIGLFPTDLLLEITMDGIGVAAGSIEDFDVLGGDIEFSVTYKDGIEPSISDIYSNRLYLGFWADQLKSESSVELLVEWQSKANSFYWGEETITINTPIYYTAPTISYPVGISNRGNITYNWNIVEGINNPIKEYRIEIWSYDSNGEIDLGGGGENVDLISTPSVKSYVFKNGKLGYYYEARIKLTPTYGSFKYLGSDKMPWKTLIFRKTSSGWEEIDNIDYVKTANGWSSAKQIFFNTSDGWIEI